MPPNGSHGLILVDDNAARRAELGFALESLHGYRVTPCATVREARDRLASGAEYAAVVTRATLGEQDTIPLLQRISHDTPTAPVVIVIAEPGEQGLRRLAWGERATAVLTAPVDESELAAALRAVLAIRRTRIDAVTMQQELASSMDRLTDVLVLVLNTAVAGSAQRGAELGRLVTSIGVRFTMEPVLSADLMRAARLAEVGRIALGPGEGTGLTAAAVTRASARLLAQVPSLEGVAALLEHVGANWDGSGVPPGIQRGQIPLRSRILRVAIDALALAGRDNGDATTLVHAAETLAAESGRHYDPAVVAALSAHAAEADPESRPEPTTHVNYDHLAVGMQLAADLRTMSGVKLLSAGTVLTATTLQVLRQRHELDPLVIPVPIHQRSR